MSITRVVDTDDSGSDTDGTVHNNAWLQSVYDSIENAFSWTSYTPTWTNGTLGDGTRSGKYLQVGKLVAFKVDLVWGSSTSSAGTWTFSLPVTSAAASGGAQIIAVGSSRDNSAGQYWMTRFHQSSTTTITPVTGDAGSAAGVSTTSPFTWAVNDELHLFGIYEAA